MRAIHHTQSIPPSPLLLSSPLLSSHLNQVPFKLGFSTVPSIMKKQPGALEEVKGMRS
jgi:hypothetical protein